MANIPPKGITPKFEQGTVKLEDSELERIGKEGEIQAEKQRKAAEGPLHTGLIQFLGDTFNNLSGRNTDGIDFYTNIERSPEEEASNDSDTPDDTPPDSSLFANYDFREQIARGGQGSIHRALDKQFNRVVAVKSLLDEHKEKQDIRRSFLTEARITARLEHPSVIPVYGLYSDDKDGLHLAMKLVHGSTLLDYLEQLRNNYHHHTRLQIEAIERKMLRQRLDFFLKVCDAMSYVHNRHIIHRDLKPENIMIGRFNETYIMDWGIAEKINPFSPKTARSVTGTPRYIAPEILNKQTYDQRSDIYLLGLILFEVVFLSRAYPQESMQEAIAAGKNGQIAPMVHAFGYQIDSSLKAIVAKATAVLPEERYGSVHALATDLRNYLGDEETTVEPHKAMGRILRYLRHHSKILLWVVVLLAFGIFGGATATLTNEYYKQSEEQKRTYILNTLNASGVLGGNHFELQMQSLETFLRVLAAETAVRLENLPSSPSERKYYDYKAGLAPETAPPQFNSHSPMGCTASYEEFVYKLAPQTTLPNLQCLLDTLYPLKVDMARAMTGEGLTTRKLGTLPPLSLGSIVIGLESGLVIAYPYTSDYSENYDPRARPWYKDAKYTTKDVVWSRPYLDKGIQKRLIMTCCAPIRANDGRFLGVVGIDIAPCHFQNALKAMGNTNRAVLNKYLVSTRNAEILQDMKGILSPISSGDEVECHHFPEELLFRKINALRNGMLFSEVHPHIVFYFQFIESLQLFYIEEISFSSLTDQN